MASLSSVYVEAPICGSMPKRASLSLLAMTSMSSETSPSAVGVAAAAVDVAPAAGVDVAPAAGVGVAPAAGVGVAPAPEVGVAPAAGVGVAPAPEVGVAPA